MEEEESELLVWDDLKPEVTNSLQYQQPTIRNEHGFTYCITYCYIQYIMWLYTRVKLCNIHKLKKGPHTHQPTAWPVPQVVRQVNMAARMRKVLSIPRSVCFSAAFCLACNFGW